MNGIHPDGPVGPHQIRVWNGWKWLVVDIPRLVAPTPVRPPLPLGRYAHPDDPPEQCRFAYDHLFDGGPR